MDSYEAYTELNLIDRVLVLDETLPFKNFACTCSLCWWLLESLSMSMDNS